MTLFIDTTDDQKIYLALEERGCVLAEGKYPAPRRQAERLLPSLQKLLDASGRSLVEVKKIKVVGRGGSFTSLRIGVLTANALAFALKVPLEAVGGGKVRAFGRRFLVEPDYGREPNIGRQAKKGFT